jgi:hypothetical protein
MSPLSLLAVLPILAPAAQEPIERTAPKKTVLPDEPVVLPLDLSRGWPVIEVFVGAEGPYQMILDTGASVTVLNKGMREALGLESLGKTRIGDPSNPTAVEADLVELEFLGIGDAYFEDVPAIAWEEDLGLGRMGLAGIVGFPVFADCLLTLDYPAQEVRIHTGELPEPDGRRVLALTPEGPLNLTIQVGGETVDAHLDSGNPGGLTLPGHLEEKLALVPGSEFSGTGRRASGPTQYRGGILEANVAIGGVVLERPRVAFDASLPMANFGKTFLDGCPVTLDLKNRRLELGAVEPAPRRVVRAGPGARRTPPPGSRHLGVEIRMEGGGSLTVGRVVPGSLAEESGIEAGDVLVSVDGKPLSMSDRSPLSDALAGTGAFALGIERAGKELVIEIPAQEEESEGQGASVR